MKISTLLFSIILVFSTQAQKFSLPAEEFPFFDVVEWKGTGALLLNRDPSGLKRKINITLVGEKNTSIWQESFNPEGKEYYFIAGENARYVYFLDQLQPVEGKISFHQISSAGNVKSSTAQLGQAIKKLGNYDINLMKIIDVITTDKALLFFIRYQDKKEKKFTDFMISMTHHNMLLYPTIVGELSELSLKDTRYGHWAYSGFQGDQIFFATRDVQEKKSGWAIRTFTSKAELTETRFIEGPNVQFDMLSSGSFGTSGRFYLENIESSAGQLHRINDKFILVGQRTDGGSKVLESYQLVNAKWEKISTSKLPVEQSKKIAPLNTLALNEGIACHFGGKTIFLPMTVGQKVITNSSTAFTPFNPSSVMIESLNNRFAVSLPSGVVFFDTQQLNKPGSVNFEFSKK